MEGEFLRGVVHGKATYYLDNGTRCSSVKKEPRNWNLFLDSRFIGLFRKGVPHGRALVIGEDGKQVKVHMQIFGTIEHIIEHLLSTFMIEGVGRVLLSRPAWEAGSWTWTSRYNGEEGNNSFRKKTRWKLTCAVKLFLFQNELRLRRMSLQFSD